MATADYLLESLVGERLVCRAVVLGVDPDGTVRVACAGADRAVVACDLLETADGSRLRLVNGDRVLVWRDEASEERAVLLGRIGRSRVPEPAPEPPAELVLEARENLTLKCGDGSITFRGDGKILIKGKDLVSHAQRRNRIKGGSVAIN